MCGSEGEALLLVVETDLVGPEKQVVIGRKEENAREQDWETKQQQMTLSESS